MLVGHPSGNPDIDCPNQQQRDGHSYYENDLGCIIQEGRTPFPVHSTAPVTIVGVVAQLKDDMGDLKMLVHPHRMSKH